MDNLMVLFQMYVTQKQRQIIRDLARKRGMKNAEVGREMIDYYLENHPTVWEELNQEQK